MTRRPVKVVQSRAKLGHGVTLARPGRGDEYRRGRRGGEQHDDGVALLGAQVRSLDGRARLLLTGERRHSPFRGGEDLLFGVQVGQRAVPFLVRRPVDAAAVRRTDTQAGNVGEVGGGDLNDVGSGPS